MRTGQSPWAVAMAFVAALLPAPPVAAQLAEPTLEQAVVAGRVASPEDFQSVLVVCNGAPAAARAGLRLAPGCIVESGPGQVVATVDGDAVEIIAEPGTQFDFLPDGIRVVLGQVFVKVRSVDIRSWFRVETTHGTASVRSTQFDVQAAPGRAVFRLLEGRLRIDAFDSGEQADIEPGQRAEIVDRREVRTARMSRAEIRAIVTRLRRTEQVLLGTARAQGSYVGLLVPDLDAPAAPAVIDRFIADDSTLSWSTRDAVRVEIAGLGSVPASGSRVVRPQSTTTYTLIATGEDGRSVSRQATVRAAPAPVLPPVIDDFRWDGQRLGWRTRNAVQVQIQGLGRVPPSGTQAVRPPTTTTYTLVATGEDGRSVSRQVVVQMAAAPVIDELRWDGRALRWRTRNADTVELTGFGVVAASGQVAVQPERDTRYTLTARGRDGRIDQRSVTVPGVPAPTIAYFRRDGFLLLWSVRDASRVDLSGVGAVAAAGSRQVAPGTYTLTASNRFGRSARATVVVPPPRVVVPRLTVPPEDLRRAPRIEQNPGSLE